ncbi:unnamed protein product [Caenorhabditis bovis]|uniref:Uncharacterized protein n=1 Tax=Caenorhabditis bovis TaxID=2654633 RepID=A0A8S1FCA3_9PELO|nr:unnamed protein product [Caenorhabditis bovis]
MTPDEEDCKNFWKQCERHISTIRGIVGRLPKPYDDETKSDVDFILKSLFPVQRYSYVDCTQGTHYHEHPVRVIGRAITRLETVMERLNRNLPQNQ